MTARERMLSVAGGAAAGVFGGLFGIGGGIVIVPFLTGLLGATQHQAHGTSLAVIGATAAAGLGFYGVAGRVDWPTAAIAGVASIGTARLGVRVASRLSPRKLRFAFAVFLGVVGLRLLWRAVPEPSMLVDHDATRVAAALAIGALVGFLAGFMGVGGGILAVPAFTLALDMPQHLAQGTSLALILVTAPVGAWEHSRHGNVMGRLVLWLALGAVLGGAAASAIAQALPADLLTRAFAVFLIFQSIRSGIEASRAPGRSDGAKSRPDGP